MKNVYVEHCSYAKQELDWSGLSEQSKIQRLQCRSGFLNEGFWSELGKLRQLREIEMWWPEQAKSRPGSLVDLRSLKKLNGVCLFNYVPEAFRAFAECPALENVKIDQCKIDDASAAGIGAMAKVKDCYIWNTELTDAGMQALCHWPQIKSLVLCENSSNPARITKAGFAALANLKTLESLHLQGFDAVTADGWANLRRLPRLKQFKVMSNPAYDLMEAIGPLPTVEKLSLSYCNSVGSAGIRQLQAMPRLRSLVFHVNRCRPYHMPLDEVGALRQLTSVVLGGLHKTSDDQLGRLASLRELRELCLYEVNKISDRGIAALAHLKKLRVVSFHSLPKLTNQTVKLLASLPNLDTLFLRCTGKITDMGLANLGAARRLTTLHLDYARSLTGDRLLQLARRLPLQELMVASSPHLTDEDLFKLADHSTLKRVLVSQCKNVTKEGLKKLAEMRPDWKLPAFSFWKMM
jgi:Leucine-rich repeat (LRR) protein